METPTPMQVAKSKTIIFAAMLAAFGVLEVSHHYRRPARADNYATR